jgi:hypothetical protein
MADNYSFKDAAGNTATHASKEISSGIHASKHLPVDNAGVELAKAEDAAHSSGDKGYMLLAVRKDSAAALAGTDGDYIPLIVDAQGRLHIAPNSAAGDIAHDAADSGNPIKVGGKAASSAPTAVSAGDRVDAYFDLNGKLWINSDLVLTDDAAYTPATSKVSPAGATYQTTVDEVDGGDIGLLRMSIRRGLMQAADQREVLCASASAVFGDVLLSSTAPSSGFAAPTTGEFTGAWAVASKYLFIPMADWRDLSFQIVNQLTNGGNAVTLTVQVDAWLVNSASTNAQYPIFFAAGISSKILFAAHQPGVGFGNPYQADYIYACVEALKLPCYGFVVKVTPSALPDAGSWRVQIARRS